MKQFFYKKNTKQKQTRTLDYSSHSNNWFWPLANLCAVYYQPIKQGWTKQALPPVPKAGRGICGRDKRHQAQSEPGNA